MEKAIIRFERVVSERTGRRMYRVTGIEGVALRGALPEEYTSGTPCFWLHGRSVVVRDDPRTEANRAYPWDIRLDVGEEISEATYARLMDTLVEAAERLRRINRKIRKMAQNWSGDATITV